MTSELDAIEGVGEKTVQKLLKEFGSSELVRAPTRFRLARSPSAALEDPRGCR
jgi:excinuclease UvrABC nuclease subunit